MQIIPFDNAPFPFHGMLPDGSAPFLDVVRDGRRGHTSPRGGVYWEDETYSERSVLLAAPASFDVGQPGAIVVYLHGNNTRLQRDVVERQRVAAQVESSRLNAVLVAPQFAVDALDSSAGKFWLPGSFARFMAEAARRLSELAGAPASRFDDMPIILVAYSGGYNPAAYVLSNGDVNERLSGVVLLDAVFGETTRFADWIARHASNSFFLSAYGAASALGNETLMNLLRAEDVEFSRKLPDRLGVGTIVFLGSGAGHENFVTRAFVPNPLQALLDRV